MHTKVIELNEYSNKEVSLLVEAVLIEMLIVFGIVSLFTEMFMPVFYAIIVMIMFVMAYNNAKIFKKKNMTAIYIIVGLFVLITTIMEYI